MRIHDFSRQLGKIRHRCGGCARDERRAIASLVRRAHAATIIRGGKIAGWRLPSGETVCAKRRYPSRESAQQHLAMIAAARTDGHRIPVREYQCDACKGWHVTSIK